MQCFCAIVTIVFLIYASVAFPWFVISDLRHPERWSDPAHDPRLLPPVIAVIAVLLVIRVRQMRRLSRVERRTDAVQSRGPTLGSRHDR
jgi:hypothetical protein